jgi:ABC-type transport system involved in cytochrome c biogenesis permease subunit
MKEARGGTRMKYVGGLGLLLLLIGSYIGLFVAPAERHMGDVARIMYVHVPTAWVAIGKSRRAMHAWLVRSRSALFSTPCCCCKG